MDDANIRNMKRILQMEDKIFKFKEFAGDDTDIADPWYTGDFEMTYRDIVIGIEGFIEYLRKEGKI